MFCAWIRAVDRKGAVVRSDKWQVNKRRQESEEDLAKFSTQVAVQEFGVTRLFRSARFSGLSQRAVSPGVYAGGKDP